MIRIQNRLALGFALLIAATVPAAGQTPAVVQPIPGADPYVAVPNGRFLADSAHQYKVVFEARKGADKPDQLIQAVNLAGSEMNTFAAHRVPSANVKLVLVFHTTAGNEAVLTNAAYRAKHGVNNPNLPVLAALKRQGVEIYVCGQSLLGDKVPLSSVDTSVATIAEDGVVVLMTYGSMGYAQLVF
jgi:intracellular sulfur oxidation DsrE/DsrF family protein